MPSHLLKQPLRWHHLGHNNKVKNLRRMVKLQLKQIRVLPGQRVLLENISWQDFEAILNELGNTVAVELHIVKER
jgi:hypothetical protein